jgi:hypothetical protein
MQALLPPPTFWLRASLLAASGLALASAVASVCVKSGSPGDGGDTPRAVFPLDEQTFRRASQVDRLYEGVELPGPPAGKASR